MIENIIYKELLVVAKSAGDAIMQIYLSDKFDEKTKADSSPLTAADIASHKIIKDALSRLTPNMPIMSEEGKLIDYATRSKWTDFWLVDPLDGTKEFIKKKR